MKDTMFSFCPYNCYNNAHVFDKEVVFYILPVVIISTWYRHGLTSYLAKHKYAYACNMAL